MKRVGIVIVNYYSQELTCDCIASLKAVVERLELTFIVVDNSDEKQAGFISQKHPDAVMVSSPRNVGFAGGCNLGIEYALEHNFDYVQLMNPDTRVEQDFLSPLLEVLENNSSLGMAAPKILRDTETRDIWYGGGEMNWWMGGPVQIFDNRNDDKGEIQQVPFLSGCVLMLKLSAVRQVGKMDESYFLYYEDADYVQRFIKAGFGAVYVPGAAVLHNASATVGFHSPDYVYYFSRNRMKFMKRWAQWYHFAVYMLYNSLIKLPGAVVVFGIIKRKPGLVKAYFRGYLDGLKG